MSNLVILFIHFIATLARLLGPGGVRSLVAESLLLKHQLLIVARSRQRSPNLCTSDRILAGLMALLVRPTRLLRSAIVLKPSTLLAVPTENAIQRFSFECNIVTIGSGGWDVQVVSPRMSLISKAFAPDRIIGRDNPEVGKFSPLYHGKPQAWLAVGIPDEFK